MTLKEKLQRSLEVKRRNLLSKSAREIEAHELEMADIREKLEVVELQLSGLKK